MKNVILMTLGVSGLLTACATTPEPVAPPPVIVAEPVQTCTPISAAEEVVIPAKTETYIAITEIENPPYDPIQRRETMVREIEPERIIYVDSQGREILDLCPQGESAE